MARSKNPIEKLFSLQDEVARTLEHLLSQGDIVEALKEIKEKKLTSKKDDKNELSPTLIKIQKLLLMYPGFQKQMLETLNTSIKSAEKMGVLENYKGKAPKSGSGKNKGEAQTSEENQ